VCDHEPERRPMFVDGSSCHVNCNTIMSLYTNNTHYTEPKSVNGPLLRWSIGRRVQAIENCVFFRRFVLYCSVISDNLLEKAWPCNRIYDCVMRFRSYYKRRSTSVLCCCYTDQQHSLPSQRKRASIHVLNGNILISCILQKVGQSHVRNLCSLSQAAR